MLLRHGLFFLLWLGSLSPAYAVLTIEITGGQQGGQPISIVPFAEYKGILPPTEDIGKIIREDLYRSGRFSPTKLAQLPARPAESKQISFPQWQATGVPHLVIGRIMPGVGGYTIEFQLFDIFTGRQVIGLSYLANNHNLRHIAHRISDAIYQALTGERGVFSTRIAYITVKRDQVTRRSTYKLYIADADGANPHMMLKSNEPIFSPTWSPDKRRIAYVSLENKRSAIYIQDLQTGQRSVIAQWRGLNTAPSWSPDGRHLALTLSKDGNSEIYLLNLATKKLTRLTHNPAIDTEAEWAPDGKSLAFTSDRSGKPQVYRVSVNGGQAQRLTFDGRYNARPRFSPDGKKIALLHNGGNGYRIALLNLENRQIRALSNTSLDESPSFAPNGSMILYSTGKELAAVSIDGGVKQRLMVDLGEEIREPAWSPFNK